MLTCYVDPSAKARSGVDSRSSLEVFLAAGLDIQLARTNSIEARIGALDSLLGRTLHTGQPAIIIDPSCSTLITALSTQYRFRLKKKMGSSEPILDDKPEKLHPWSDVVDALQYLCLEVTGAPARTGGGILSHVVDHNMPARVRPSPVRIF